MFVCVSRVTLDIPAAGSVKARRQVLRRVTDRIKAKFNVAVAEVEGDDLANRAVVALAVVGNERRHVSEMMEKIIQFVDDLYVAPVSRKEVEIVPFADLFSGMAALGGDLDELTIPRGERSLAEAEGLGAWEDRHTRQLPPPSPSAPSRKASGQKQPKKDLTLDDARAVARGLRNRREWEKD
ncbi:MAG: DUF503 domain-containing protein [Archangium sp.]|nr:DUF503 domain-containing protein [Archangium sp.]